MDASAQPYVVGVRFSKVGKIYHFDARRLNDLQLGDMVVVETSRGWQLGEIAQMVSQPAAPPEGVWKEVDRRARKRQAELIEANGGREAVIKRGDFGFTPAPGTVADFR